MTEHDSYDSPWKEAIEFFFEPFMVFFFPHIHAAIDWSRGYEFLDTELQQIVGDAEIGKRLADKLVKVWTHDGAEAWLLIHIEVQGYWDDEFPVRLYIYNYRIFDRYNRDVVSLAVLSDDNPTWRPDTYTRERLGCRVTFNFPIVKLLDYRERWDDLVQSRNPFALVVMAHLKTQETRGNADQRRQWKMTMVRMMHERGYTREEMHQLFRVIDWMLKLPKEQARLFIQELHAYEEEHRMKYITSVEEIWREDGIAIGREEGIVVGREEGIVVGREEGIVVGREEGREEGRLFELIDGITLALELRYGADHPLLPRVLEEVHALTDVEQLKTVQQAIRTAPTLENLRAVYATEHGD